MNAEKTDLVQLIHPLRRSKMLRKILEKVHGYLTRVLHSEENRTPDSVLPYPPLYEYDSQNTSHVLQVLVNNAHRGLRVDKKLVENTYYLNNLILKVQFLIAANEHDSMVRYREASSNEIPTHVFIIHQCTNNKIHVGVYSIDQMIKGKAEFKKAKTPYDMNKFINSTGFGPVIREIGTLYLDTRYSFNSDTYDLNNIRDFELLLNQDKKTRNENN